MDARSEPSSTGHSPRNPCAMSPVVSTLTLSSSGSTLRVTSLGIVEVSVVCGVLTLHHSNFDVVFGYACSAYVLVEADDLVRLLVFGSPQAVSAIVGQPSSVKAHKPSRKRFVNRVEQFWGKSSGILKGMPLTN